MQSSFPEEKHVENCKALQPLRASRNVLFAGFSASVIDIAFIVLTVILNKQVLRYGGEAALAVFGVVITCSSLFQHLFSGVGQATQPIVSTNFGAGLRDRIHEIDKLSVLTALLMGVAFALVGILFPVQITKLFVDATPRFWKLLRESLAYTSFRSCRWVSIFRQPITCNPF